MKIDFKDYSYQTSRFSKTENSFQKQEIKQALPFLSLNKHAILVIENSYSKIITSKKSSDILYNVLIHNNDIMRYFLDISTES